MAQIDYKNLQNKLIAFRETMGISSREKMAAMLGLTFSCYSKIEQGDRRPSRETLAAMMRYFQSINNADMVLSLLRCIDTDTEALTKQPESAAWHWLPELPKERKLVRVAYTVNISASTEVHTSEAFYISEDGWYLKDFGGELVGDDYINICNWHYLLEPPLPEATSAKGESSDR